MQGIFEHSNYIYLDNAASTPIAPEVIEEMRLIMSNNYGNPSSTHRLGREARVIIENSRKTIANLLHAKPSEIFFTSGGTEANNIAIQGCINSYNIKHVITSELEHPAVLMVLNQLEKNKNITIHYLPVNSRGQLDYQHLEQLLKEHQEVLVSLMHANNEIGNLLSIKEVGEMCKNYNAFFHSDMVQTIGKYDINLNQVPVNFASCSAHKFHGPKGIGILYIRNGVIIEPLAFGGGQERGMRSGTENAAAIAGMAKALQIAMEQLDDNQKFIGELKTYLINQIRKLFPEAGFNGECETKGLYNLVNIWLPLTEDSEMLIFNLDMHQIFVSGGSACASGAHKEPVITRLLHSGEKIINIRFSFSKFNTQKDIDIALYEIKKLLKQL